MESTQPVPPGSSEQEQELASPREQAPRASLPPELDPSGFTERAPALGSLLPDEALSQALARGDAFALHRALTDRLDREPSGHLRDTLRELLGNRSLFTVAESPPWIAGFLGSGVQWVDLPSQEEQQTPFIATRALRLLGVPLWPLGEHLVQRGRDGQLQVLGRVAAGADALSRRRAGFLAVGVLVLASAAAALAPFAVREVQIVNGLSRPVEVSLEGESVRVEPGQLVQRQVYGLGGSYDVRARWPGVAKPFESLELVSSQRMLYNILGAGSLKWEGVPPASSSPEWLQGRTFSLQPEARVELRGGWEAQVRTYLQRDQWYPAAMLAKSIFLADPSQIQAGQQAALLLVQNDPQQALWFARELPQTFPDDPAVGQLAQDLLIAQGEGHVAFKLYESLARAAPSSVGRALLAARAAPPEQAREAYARVRERFPESPEAMRALARILLVDAPPQEALNLLKEALSQGPESLEDLELRVRTLVSAREVREASVAVKQFRGDPRHASWELAVLGGRLARIAGPSRTQYVTRDLLPSALARSPEHTVAFALLTGDSSVSDAELNAVADPVAREALAITRALFKDFDEAVEQAARARAPVLSRLDLETAALLALELSRRDEKQAAQRVFGSSLALLAARVPLLDYVNMRVVRPEFPLLPPGLRAAAHLIRARASPQDRSEELDRARRADVLGGMARRALDGHEEETVPREEGVHSHSSWRPKRREPFFQLIRGSGPPPAASPHTQDGEHPR